MDRMYLDEKTKFTYIIGIVGLLQLVGFLIIYIFVAKSLYLVIETLIIIFFYLIQFLFLYKGYKKISKVIIILGLIIQVNLLVFLWFPKETNLTYFFFLVPPIVFMIFDLGDKAEKIILILLNFLVIVCMMGTAFVEPMELIVLDEGFVNFVEFITVFSTIVSEVTVFFFYALNLHKTHKELAFLANTDALTNIYNRRVLFDKGEILFQSYQKYGKPFTVMILDIDHFKQVNDIYGHMAGDKVLKEMSDLISKNIRKDDILCRYGGEEFAILFKNLNKDNMLNLDEIRKRINKKEFIVDNGEKVQITISAGVVSCNKKNKSFGEMVLDADKLLYSAKLSGRNKIVYGEE